MTTRNSSLRESVSYFVIYTCILSLSASGQVPESARPPGFEVVSIKRSGIDRQVIVGEGSFVLRRAPFRYAAERVSCDLPLLEIIKEAFSIADDHQVSGPAWTAEEQYQIAALTPQGTNKETARLMLQTMLQERFGLRYHREQRVLPVYALVEAKGGFKLRPLSPDQPRREVKVPAGAPVPAGRGRLVSGPGQFRAAAITLANFARSMWMDAPVVDVTGIKGEFDIDLKWEPDGAAHGPNDPVLLRLIEQKLGLKLEKRKLPVDVLVIDQVKKTPTPN